MIRFEKISKVFPPDVNALEEVSLDVQSGELMCLIGTSGCGKTTLLKTVNRLIEPSSGRIFIDDQDISRLNHISLRRNIGYVIQQTGLYPHLTVEENICYVLRITGNKKTSCRSRAEELMDIIGMDRNYLGRFPRELSGGQQQRVGVARALAANPNIILMDEPFGAIDQITRIQLQDELVRLQSRLNKTIIFVTHDLQEAIKLADRIALMDQGNILQIGTANELLFFPKDDFVENFMGSSSFFNVMRLLPVEKGLVSDYPVFRLSQEDAARKEVEQKARDLGWSEYPVIDKEDQLVGYFPTSEHHNGDLYPVNKLLSPKITFEQALKQLFISGKSRLPVTTDDKKIIGFFDFAQAYDIIRKSSN